MVRSYYKDHENRAKGTMYSAGWNLTDKARVAAAIKKARDYRAAGLALRSDSAKSLPKPKEKKKPASASTGLSMSAADIKYSEEIRAGLPPKVSLQFQTVKGAPRWRFNVWTAKGKQTTVQIGPALEPEPVAAAFQKVKATREKFPLPEISREATP